jgi:hypothetical protein
MEREKRGKLKKEREVHAMKKVLVAAALVGIMLFGATGAQAFWVGSVYNPNVGDVPNIQGLDWSSSGSGLAAGMGPAGGPIAPGDTFDFLFQAKLIGATDVPGDPVTAFDPGLNVNFEYTLVAKIPEVVVAIVPISATITAAFFAITGPGEWYMYYDGLGAPTPGAQSDVATGTGFEDGTLAASGTFTPGQVSQFTYDSSVPQGIGSFILNGPVNFSNPAYFDPAITIFSIRAEGTLNQPALDSTTLGFFDVAGGPLSRYMVVDGEDTLFKADASSKFRVIPEPSTMILLGAGLLGLTGLARRKQN